MKEVYKSITTHPLIYVTRDLERALGMAPENGYLIITNAVPYALEFQQKYPDNIWLIAHPEGELNDTHELLLMPEVEKVITENTVKKGARLMVFKNTGMIEEIAKLKGWQLVNPSASLAEKIENKITQVQWLDETGKELSKLLPEHKVLLTKDISWKKIFTDTPNGEPFILQWAHSHTGDGTILVRNEKELAALAAKFPEREARVTRYVRGPMFTSNIVIGPRGPLSKNISYQITGMLPFTENPFSTVGNDWSAPATLLSDAHHAEYQKIAEAIGARMFEAGWRGLFGIDVIYDEERDSLHLIEINARQPASTTYESRLQTTLRNHGIIGLTTFEAHVAGLLNIPIDEKQGDSLIEVNDGAQIIERLTHTIITDPEVSTHLSPESLRAEGFTVLEYEATALNSDLLRIQSNRGIIEAHNKFNERGKKILQ